MKIIHYIGSIDRSAGGTATYLQLIGQELKHMMELVIVTGTSPDRLDLPGIKVIEMDFGLYRWFFLRGTFKRILETEQPDLVHINGIWNPQNFLFQKVSQELKIKVLISPHGMLEPFILNRHPLRKQAARYLYQDKAIRAADYLHATAEAELNQIRKLGFVPPATVIPNGIDVSEVLPRKRPAEENSTRTLLFLSRIHPKKGIELLIRAVAQLRNKRIRVIVAGEGEASYLKHLQDLATETGVEKQFSFIGGVYGQQKWELLAQADLFVLPTYSENFGIVVIEALAAGVPVITTRGTPWRELETMHCGWWIDLSVENLAGAIKEAFDLDPTQYQEMSRNGVELVRSKYQIKAVSRDTYQLYEQILQN